MPTPLFNFSAIFGSAIRMKAAVLNPLAFQQAAYPGLNGVEETPLGDRGAITTVTGCLAGASVAQLNAAVFSITNYYNAGWFVLTDQYGNNWPYVRLDAFEPGEIRVDISTGYYWMFDYQARFFHLVASTLA